jgi:hypothetical protein
VLPDQLTNGTAGLGRGAQLVDSRTIMLMEILKALERPGAFLAADRQ